ncbi:MAG: lipocalin-like domain-containing protein [Bacteroidetes bacterium]|nr:lipocalin-like domain-containing protein [Bacteroidota bacterium]
MQNKNTQKTRTVFVYAIALLFMVISNGCNSKPGTPAKDRRSLLNGMYSLIIVQNMDSAGHWQQDNWAKEGTGYILYDGSGHMAVQITNKGFKDYPWLNEMEAIIPGKVNIRMDTMSLNSVKDALSVFSSDYVYFANYTIDDTADIVQHNRISASIPSNWNTSVRRAFSFSGDTLILSCLDRNLRLKWLKLK